MATVKKLPERLCLGCQERFLKKDLVRIVKSPEGEFSVDNTGRLIGRPAFIVYGCGEIRKIEISDRGLIWRCRYRHELSGER